MERLNDLKAQLAEAMLDKENNKLYIEDLLLSIELQQIEVDRINLYRTAK